MADPKLSGFIAAMMRDDIRPTLRSPEGLDLAHYIAQILERLQNPAVRHQLAQIAWDGSQKLPVRLFGTIADNLAAKRSIERLCVPIAAWMHFVRLQAARGEQMIDPLAARLLAIGRSCRNDAATDIPTFMTLDTVFPASLAADWRFIAALRGAYAEPLPALKTGARDPVLSAQP
jgi:fructuronate reductase